MRLLIADHLYPECLEQFRARNPGLASESYGVQHAALMRERVFWGECWSEPMAKYGWESVTVAPNAEALQRRWALENGVAQPGKDRLLDVLLAQVGKLRPDVLLLTGWAPLYGPDFIPRCRREWPGIRLVAGWSGEMHPAAAHFRHHDLVLSCAPDTVDFLCSQGVRARHLNHAFDPAVLSEIGGGAGAAERRAGLGFIGQIGLLIERMRLLAAVAEEMDTAIYGFLVPPGPPVYRPAGLKGKLREAYFRGLSEMERCGMGRAAAKLPRHAVYREAARREETAALAARLRDRVRSPVFGIEMFRTLAGFDICLNVHGATPYASNMRLFEATGVGTCLLTDAKRNLPALFEPDREVVAYGSEAECVEKARYLLDHAREREAIAAAGQRRTLKDHTFSNRAGQIDAILRSAMA